MWRILWAGPLSVNFILIVLLKSHVEWILPGLWLATSIRQLVTFVRHTLTYLRSLKVKTVKLTDSKAYFCLVIFQSVELFISDAIKWHWILFVMYVISLLVCNLCLFQTQFSYNADINVIKNVKKSWFCAQYSKNIFPFAVINSHKRSLIVRCSDKQLQTVTNSDIAVTVT